MTISIIEGLSAVADGYDLVICDIWGVVHNGIEPYADVADCLAHIRGSGRKAALLSNAPRPSANVALELARIGIAQDQYDILLTSGEATRQALLERTDDFHAALGEQFFHLGPERCLPTVEGIGTASGIEDADFIVCTGLFDDEADRPGDYDDLLSPAAMRGVPLICANPDIIVMRGDRLIPCAGAVAARYGELGGRVVQHGKPHPGVFEQVMAAAGAERSRTVMIGDGFPTDIEGARRAGIDSIWVAGGIHAAEVGMNGSDGPRADRVEAVIERSGERPVAVMARLKW
jgi:HAD superfamily hydrolase (TIGR01459 family)